MTIAVADIVIPPDKPKRLAEADAAVDQIDKQFQRGLITDDERYEQVVDVWQKTTNDLSTAMMDGLDGFGSVRMMSDSGARGNKGQISQLGGMRGLMADPSGRIIDVPVRSNFREGMTVLEYFISTHGARKGLADTALRTADSGYLTRRLVDVAQDVITREEDCGTQEGTWITRAESAEIASNEKGAYQKRMIGRLSAADLHSPRDRRAHRRAQRGDHRGHRAALWTRPGSTRSSSARRSRARPARASAGCATAATWPPACWWASARPWASSPPSRSASRARS